jgi:hypothetical protein
LVHENSSSDPARAFEDLRAEVTVLRRAVEAIPQTLEEGRAPDYGEDLAKLAKELAAVACQVELMGQHPALRMTPADHHRAVAQTGADLMRGALQSFERATQAADGERRQLSAMIGTARAQESQFKVVALVAGIALLIGLVLSPIFASILPFGLNARVAALVMRNDRWNAGAALMAAQNPQGWNELGAAEDLVKANRERLLACQAVATRAGRSQTCSVLVAGH